MWPSCQNSGGLRHWSLGRMSLMSLVFGGLTVSHHSAMKCWIASSERGHCVLCSGLGAYNTNIIYTNAGTKWNYPWHGVLASHIYLGPHHGCCATRCPEWTSVECPPNLWLCADGRGTKKWSFGNCHVFWSKEVVYKTFRTALTAVIYAGILDSQVPLALLKRHDTWYVASYVCIKVKCQDFARMITCRYM